MIYLRGILFFLLLFNSLLFAQIKIAPSIAKVSKDNLIEKLLKSHPEKFAHLINNASIYNIQIIYTQVNHKTGSLPELIQYSYNLNPNHYFYPASLVKLPVSAMALEKCNRLGISSRFPMFTLKGEACQKNVFIDSTAEHYKPTVINYVKKMMLVSDNDAYSRLYEWLTPDSINLRLKEIGLNYSRIYQRFDPGCSVKQNLITNPVVFTNLTGDTIYRQALQQNKEPGPHPLKSVKKGKAYRNASGKLIRKPKDFTQMNFLPLQEINDFLIGIIFPKVLPPQKRLNLNKDDRILLLNAMSAYPRESDFPLYPADRYEDSYKKYLLLANYHDTIKQDTLRVFNVVGQSYGWLSDCAYFADFKNKVDFFLCAVIYVNKNRIMNDGRYEYKTIGFPFLNDLGRLIYDYDRSRLRTSEPDLHEFIIPYEKPLQK